MEIRHLSELLGEAVARRPDHPAVEDEDGRQLTYAAPSETQIDSQPGWHVGASIAATESGCGCRRVSRL